MIRKLVAVLGLGFAMSSQAAGGIDTEAFFAAQLTGLDGEPVAMAQFRGRPLIVNFWARWCAPCREEIPELVRLRDAQGEGGIEVVGVALESQVEGVREFATAQDMRYPVVLAAKQGIPLMKALGNAQGGVPFTVYIGRDGKAVGSKLGIVRADDLAAATQTLLK
ncbi:Thiol-disulfide oxidoreductase ResA [Thauera sp. GDN1]|uniref:TlpA family protein disulfide reductase n=1 Tax=Thauera sp. GDN1 TaxID=2944810 RepID=UPI002478629C|nr:TlpA disulfide reductase family protein [Thauera sp. GDN1]WEN43634.1 Thiol-disulfide oxidoreductase ResA [Thauera sp. GDN1]